MPREHGPELGTDGRRRRRHEERCDLAVFLPERRGERERLPSALGTRVREERPLLHRDVPQERLPEPGVDLGVDGAVLALCLREKRVDGGMVGGQEPLDGAGHGVVSDAAYVVFGSVPHWMRAQSRSCKKYPTVV